MDVRVGLWRKLSAKELMWCWRRLLRVPWTARRSNQSILKEISPSWVSIGRTDAEAGTPIIWPSDMKNWLIWEDSDAGKVWRWDEKEMTEAEMVRWHHWCNGHEFWMDIGSRSWWLTGRPVVLQSMVSQIVGHYWVTELNLFSFFLLSRWEGWLLNSLYVGVKTRGPLTDFLNFNNIVLWF